jgi:hypothetical protein
MAPAPTIDIFRIAVMVSAPYIVLNETGDDNEIAGKRSAAILDTIALIKKLLPFCNQDLYSANNLFSLSHFNGD